MDKNTLYIWAVKNSIALIAWTVLAIVFNKWWIALFAALFMSSLETKYKNYSQNEYDHNDKWIHQNR